MDAPVSEEEQFQENLENANKAKETYWRLYGELVSNVSLEHMERFSTLVQKDNVTFNKDVLLKDFQASLCEDVLYSMEKSWETCNIGVNIAMLGMIKKKFEDTKDPNWRPMGKSVREQTLPIRFLRLEAKRRYLKKQLDYQSDKLNDLLKQNERYRNEIEQVKLQRSFIRDQMARGCAELDHLKTDYKEMIKQTMYKD